MLQRLGLLAAALALSCALPAAADPVRYYALDGQTAINVDANHPMPVDCVIGCSGSSGGGGGNAPSATMGAASPAVRSPISYQDAATGNEDPALGDATGLYAKIVNSSLPVSQFGTWTVAVSSLPAITGAVSISGSLPAFASTPTFNCGSGCYQATQPISAASLPPPCAAVPAPDTLNGTSGSATPCTPHPDDTRPTAVQRAIVTTASDGSWAVTWGRPFSVAPALSLKPIKPIMSGASKGDCGVSSSTTTGATGSCWTYQSTVVSILGATVSPISTAAAGVQVMIVGGTPTQ